MVFCERELQDDSTESKIIEFDFDFGKKLKIDESGIFSKQNHELTKIRIEIKPNY